MSHKSKLTVFILGCIALIMVLLVGFDFPAGDNGFYTKVVAQPPARPQLQNATSTPTRTPTIAVTATATSTIISRAGSVLTPTATITNTARLTSTLSSGRGIILLNPFIGPSASPVTVNGQRWQPGERIIVYIVDGDQEYAIGSTLVQSDGTFSLSFFVPALFTEQRTVTIVARTLDSEEFAQALYAFTDIDPEPTPTLGSRSAQGEVNVDRLNVRTGPSINYPRIGSVELGEVVEIEGVNDDWWRITYPNSRGDYGWVSGTFIDAVNAGEVPFFPAPPTPVPPPTVTPTPLPPQPVFACNPGQWSGCGGASCQAEYVSQCGSDGQWGQCVWDPGSCSLYGRSGGGDDDDDDDGNNNNNNNNNNDNDDDDDADEDSVYSDDDDDS